MATKLLVFLVQLEASIAAFDSIMLRITDKAGDALATAAIQNAPRVTGSLRTSIKSHGAKGLKTIKVNVTAGGPSSPHDVDYATFVEEGTSRMAPRGFMRKAANKVIPLWEKELASATALLAAGRPGRVRGSIAR